MKALIGYQIELLLRSQRLVPPLVAYVLAMVLGVSAGDEASAGLGYGVAVLLPVTVWFTRCAVTAEPDASRNCLVAIAGPARVHLSALLAALLGGLAVGAVGYGLVLAVSGPAKAGAPALVAGAVGTVVCALLGAAVGALCNRPLVRAPQYAVLASLAGATLVLLVPWSPANALVRALVLGARTSHIGVLPLLWPLPVALAVAGLSFWAAATAGAYRPGIWRAAKA